MSGDSMQSATDSIQSVQTTTTVDDSITSGKYDCAKIENESAAGSVVSLIDADADVSADESHQSYIPEYPPVKNKEVFFEGGVHYFEDGNFWMEIPGLLESEDDDDEINYPILQKKSTKIKFR